MRVIYLLPLFPDSASFFPSRRRLRCGSEEKPKFPAKKEEGEGERVIAALDSAAPLRKKRRKKIRLRPTLGFPEEILRFSGGKKQCYISVLLFSTSLFHSFPHPRAEGNPPPLPPLQHCFLPPPLDIPRALLSSSSSLIGTAAKHD